MSIPDSSSSDPQIHWKRFCDHLWFDEDLGIWLDISRINFEESQLLELESRFSKAFQEMEALEHGSIANTDEQRQVGHYWLRNHDLAPEADQRSLISSQIELIRNFSHDILNGLLKPPNRDRFTDVLWIGIGGSGLGPLLMIKALQNDGEGLNFHFLDNVDPIGITETLCHLKSKLSSTLVVTVSKSGGTPEPRIAMVQARSFIEQVGLDWPSHAVAITMRDSQLDQQAKNESWLKTFDLPDWVGGRTSITSSVGLLPAALIGRNFDKFLEGASQMDEATRSKSFRNNPAALLAAAWFISGSGKGNKDMVVLPYRDRLQVFSRYLQQLVMESLGKRLDKQGNIVNQGIAVYGNKGSTDQHAYVQQLRDGIDNFFVTFIETLKDCEEFNPNQNLNPGDFLSGFLQGTRTALTDAGRQSITITMRELDESSLGALLALFERAVGLYGLIINVNAYDQPGVEAGKKAAAKILDLQEKIESTLADGVPRSIGEITQILGIESPESIFSILRHIVSNNQKLLARGDWANPKTLVFERIND